MTKRYRNTYSLNKWFGVEDLSKLALEEGKNEDLDTCPRCDNKDETVLLDQEGNAYLCDTCWDETA